MAWGEHVLTILAYIFDPRVRRRRQKERMYKRLKKLERRYEAALRQGDPIACEKIHARMNEAREKIKYLESREN